MKTALAVLAMVMMAATATAQTEQIGCYDPRLEIVCNCVEVTLPGLWEVAVKGQGKLCGELTIIGTVFMIEDEIYPVRKMKRAEAVVSCMGRVE